MRFYVFIFSKLSIGYSLRVLGLSRFGRLVTRPDKGLFLLLALADSDYMVQRWACI